MSSGPFVNSKYELDDNSICSIRVQPETLTAVGGAPTGATTLDGFARVGGSRRTYGIHARGIRLVRTIGTGDTAARRYNFLPVLTQTAYATFTIGETVNYGGVDWTISSKVPEKIK